MTRRKNIVTKNLKDYLVPIVVGVLVLFLLINIFTGSSENQAIQKENKIGISVSMDTSNTQSLIEYQGKDSVDISEQTFLYKGEKLRVKEGSLSLEIPLLGNARLGKLGELKYNEDGSFTLSSGKVWINSISNIDISMRFAKVEMGEQSYISLDQNEVASTVYVLGGFVTVENLSGQNVMVLPGEKITISRSQASNQDLDLKIMKESIDDIFKNSDWYVLNNGDSYLNMDIIDKTGNKTSTGSKIISNSSRVLVFDTIKDEVNISSSNITITGLYTDETITKITLNNREAKLDTIKKSFIFENIDTSKVQNDLVFRAYDDAGDILERRLITLYYNGGQSNKNSSTKFGNGKIYNNVDASQFTFTEPSNFPTYSTIFGEVTIKGKVFNKDVTSVRINGYELKSFSKTYGTWRYYAFERFDTLSNGTNVYKVEYFDVNNDLIYTNNYTIVKKSNTPKKDIKIISDEV